MHIKEILGVLFLTPLLYCSLLHEIFSYSFYDFSLQKRGKRELRYPLLFFSLVPLPPLFMCLSSTFFKILIIFMISLKMLLPISLFLCHSPPVVSPLPHFLSISPSRRIMSWTFDIFRNCERTRRKFYKICQIIFYFQMIWIALQFH